MNEIKFRVFTNKMIYENFDISCEGLSVVIRHNNGVTEADVGMFCHLMQYTGFEDKAGNQIFEGDILEAAGGLKITVESLAEFLIYCGRYEEKHGVPLFPSVQVVSNIFESINE